MTRIGSEGSEDSDYLVKTFFLWLTASGSNGLPRPSTKEFGSLCDACVPVWEQIRVIVLIVVHPR